MENNLEQQRSVYEIIQKGVAILKFAAKNYKFLLLGLLLGVLAATFLDYSFAHRYESYYKFTTVSSNGKSGGGLGGVLASFGIGGSSGGGVNALQVIEISTATEIFAKVLNKKIEFSGDSITVGNAIAYEFNLPKSWSERFDKQISLPFNCDVEKDPNGENCWAFNHVLKKAIGTDGESPICSVNLDKETGIFTFTTKTKSAELSQKILELWYDEVDNYYYSKVIHPDKIAFENLKATKDSLNFRLESLARRKAKLEESRLSIKKPTDKLALGRINRDFQGTGLALAKVSENFELAKLTKRNSDFVFQIFDKSLPPLQRSEPATIKYYFILSILGILGGGILAWIISMVKMASTQLQES